MVNLKGNRNALIFIQFGHVIFMKKKLIYFKTVVFLKIGSRKSKSDKLKSFYFFNKKSKLIIFTYIFIVLDHNEML